MRACAAAIILSTIENTLSLPNKRAASWAALTLGVMATGVVIRLAIMTQLDPEVYGDTWEYIATVVPFGLAGAVLIDRRPDLPFGWLLAAGSAIHVIGATFSVLGATSLIEGDGGWLSMVGLGFGSLIFWQLPIQGLINLRFPSGKLASRKGRVLEVLILGGTALATLGGFMGALSFAGSETSTISLANLQYPQNLLGRVATAVQMSAPAVVLLTIAAGIGVVIRWFRAEGLERQQLKWRSVYVLLSLALFPFAVTTGAWIFDRLDNTFFVLTLAVPVLKYRLWAIDSIIRRSTVYAAVIALLALAYLVTAGVVSTVVGDRVGSVAGAIVVAAAFAPLRDRAYRFVDRLFYGSRGDAHRTLNDLGTRLDAATAPGEVLQGIVETVSGSLKLPYAAIERTAGDAPLVSVGQPQAVVERWPLNYDGAVRGFLAASPRRGEEAFDGRDRRLLEDLAHHGGAAVHAEALTAELLRSRQRLVTAREEERRQLRRDLHDGLGPVLTGAGLSLDAARARLVSDPAGADDLVAQAKGALAQAFADLRRVVYGLRPPALDELGLAGALRSQAERLCAGAGIHLAVSVGELPEVPAGVEVAVYRTAVEAVTNVVRHSGGKKCSVELRVEVSGQLLLEVSDDGASSEGWHPGVGLTAMRERAEELGGGFSAAQEPEGFRIVASFPLRVAR